MSSAKEDLDAFLTGVESKLRLAFSSVDLARMVKSSDSFLEQLALVFDRMERSAQLQVLIGLLGLPSAHEEGVKKLLEIAQSSEEGETQDEWVRIVGGLVQDLIFSSGRGTAAATVLQNTCDKIIQAVNKQEEKVIQARQQAEASVKDENELRSLLLDTDVDPLFAPRHFSLLNQPLIRQAIPECDENPHFTVNKEASILLVDDKLEQAKAVEQLKAAEAAKRQQRIQAEKKAAIAAQQQNNNTRGLAKSSNATGANSRGPGAGGRGSLTSKIGASRSTPSASMFIRAKKPVAGGGRSLAMPNARKTAMAGSMGGIRRKGAASAVLSAGKSKLKSSKMKMIDVAEVEGLTKEHKEREDKLSIKDKLSARKRKIMEAAAAAGIRSSTKWGEATKNNGAAKKQKVEKADGNGQQLSAQETDNPSVQAPENAGQEKQQPPHAAGGPPAVGLVAAALSAYQGQAEPPTAQQQQQQQQQHAQQQDMVPATGSSDWRQLLERSNRLIPEDRQRVEQFFLHRVNPTPEVPVYKIKLNEDKTVDPATGMTVKETLYLELDYNTFGFKKLRKIKKK